MKENKTSRERKRDREHEKQGKEEEELNASDPTKTPSTTEAIQTIFCDILRYDCMLAQRCSLLHSALTSSIHHINNHTYIIILCRGAYSEYFKFTVATKVFGMHITWFHWIETECASASECMWNTFLLTIFGMWNNMHRTEEWELYFSVFPLLWSKCTDIDECVGDGLKLKMIKIDGIANSMHWHIHLFPAISVWPKIMCSQLQRTAKLNQWV